MQALGLEEEIEGIMDIGTEQIGGKEGRTLPHEAIVSIVSTVADGNDPLRVEG